MQAAHPLDVRLMNVTATVLYVLVAATFLWALGAWLSRLPMFSISSVRIENELQRTNAATLRANVAARMSGNFFTLDLDQAQRAFETVPWVRRAHVRRVWPDRLSVTLEEHRPAAFWGDNKLVNTYGEVFEANLGAVEDEDLPNLFGPEESSRQVLALYQPLADRLARVHNRIERLTLTERGSWRVDLDGGAEIELGRGGPQDVLARVDRFVGTWSQVTAEYPGPLQYADLRHRDGYAVRIRGVSVTAPKDAKRN